MFLFCVKEPGGARDIIPVILATMKRGLDICVLSSPVTKFLFTEADILTEEYVPTTQQETDSWLDGRKNIDAMILGSNGSIGVRHYLTFAARKRNIRSLAIIDEWYSYASRFQDEEGKLGKYIPDVICVQDETSFAYAVEEGLPPYILCITGSPALSELAKQARTFVKLPPGSPPILGSKMGMPSILFLSEKLSTAYGSKPGDRGTLGTYIGYQEEIVREDLASILDALRVPTTVIERLHPTENIKTPPPHSPHVNWHVEQNRYPLWPFLFHCDCIIGMRSKALLEAAIIGRHPISYQPNAVNPNLCAAVRLGLATLYTTKDMLAGALEDILKKPIDSSHSLPPLLQCTDPNATENVLNLVLENMRGASFGVPPKRSAYSPPPLDE